MLSTNPEDIAGFSAPLELNKHAWYSPPTSLLDLNICDGLKRLGLPIGHQPHVGQHA
jgi:hypothetical protein